MSDIPTVKEFMTTSVITALGHDSMSDLTRKLIKNNVSGAPVVDVDGKLIGLVSGRDILMGLSVNTFHRMGDGVVENIMYKEVFTMSPDVDVFTASSIFYEKRYRRIPVVDNSGKLIGIVTRKDVIKALDKLTKLVLKNRNV